MIACLRLPHFAASLQERAHPELQGQSFVVVDPGDQRVLDPSESAARQGVRAGMTLAQARAQCAAILALPAVHSRTQRALDDLLAALTVFSAQVEAEDGVELRADGRRWRDVTLLSPAQLDDHPAATCYVDLGAVPADEAPALAQQLLATVEEQVGAPAKLGLSSGKFPARVAAMAVSAGEALIVPGERTASFLAEFTVALLPVDGETLRQLDLLGWHTLGDIAAQPVAALLDRFGKPGRSMHRLASGHDTRPVAHYAPAAVERVRRECEGLTQWEPLLALLDTMTAQASARLLASAQTVRQIALVITLEDGTVAEQPCVLRAPTGSLQHLRAVVRELAGALPIRAGVAALELTLSDIAPAVPRQLSLFERAAVPQAHLQSVLANLIARYGEAHFHWARAVDRDARLPERRYRWEKVERP